jgi:hypothetical protein
VNQKRKEHKRRETYLSLFILSVLTAIGTLIFFQQFHYSPAVLLSNQILDDTSTRQLPPGNQPVESLMAFSHNLTPLTPPEIFDRSNLSDKINGKAELYLSAGFKRLESQRFRVSDAPEEWMEVFIYDMGDSENAFAAYSVQQRDDAQPAGFGQYSYRTENALYWIHGPYYVEIIASSPSENHSAAMAGFTKAFVDNLQLETRSIGEKALFPQSGLDPNSMTLIAADAFGFAGLDRVFTAEYKIGAAELTAFISRRKTPSEASQLALAYQEFLVTYGGDIVESGLSIKNAKIVMILDTYELIFSHGPYFAGVREAADKGPAIRLAHMLKKKLEEAASEQ